jgi:hypothetical protein
VAEFLTREWVGELDAAARRSPPFETDAGGTPFTVELRVGDAPSGEFVYQMTVSDGAARFAVGSPAAPDLVVLLDAAFAARIRSGEENVQDALLAGALKVRGDVEGLIGRAPALAAVGTVFGDLGTGGASRS